MRLTDEEWREFQSIPDQGYSHRAWVDARLAAHTAPLRAEVERQGAVLAAVAEVARRWAARADDYLAPASEIMHAHAKRILETLGSDESPPLVGRVTSRDEQGHHTSVDWIAPEDVVYTRAALASAPEGDHAVYQPCRGDCNGCPTCDPGLAPEGDHAVYTADEGGGEDG